MNKLAFVLTGIAITSLLSSGIVLEEDVDRLQDVISDDGTGANARKLASILLRIHHAPSAEDKKALAALAGD